MITARRVPKADIEPARICRSPVLELARRKSSVSGPISSRSLTASRRAGGSSSGGRALHRPPATPERARDPPSALIRRVPRPSPLPVGASLMPSPVADSAAPSRSNSYGGVAQRLMPKGRRMLNHRERRSSTRSFPYPVRVDRHGTGSHAAPRLLSPRPCAFLKRGFILKAVRSISWSGSSSGNDGPSATLRLLSRRRAHVGNRRSDHPLQAEVSHHRYRAWLL